MRKGQKQADSVIAYKADEENVVYAEDRSFKSLPCIS